MAEDISSLMGSVASTPAQKKLRKVGDHWEDEQGNKFSDAEGTQPIKSEAAQAKAGAPSVSAMEPFGVEKGTQTGGWAPQSSAMASGDTSRQKSEEEMRRDEANVKDNPEPDLAGGEAAWKYMTDASPANTEMWGSKDKFLKSWAKMSNKERSFYRSPGG